MMRHPPHTQAVLITGASGGIGWELARIFAREGYRVAAVARSGIRLAQLAGKLKADHGAEVDVLEKDLSTPDCVRELCDELDQRQIRVDVLVNNAGFAVQGMFAETDPAEHLRLLQLNILTLTHLTRQLLPHMLSQQFGRILNVASIAACFPGPLMATYNASKAYVLSFSEAISEELIGSGVTVTALCPGPTRTGFELRAGLCGAMSFRRHVMDAACVAEIGYAAMLKGRTIAVPGWRNRLRMIPIKLMPRRLLAKFARKYHETTTIGREEPLRAREVRMMNDE